MRYLITLFSCISWLYAYQSEAHEFLWRRQASPFQQHYGKAQAPLGAVFYISLSCFHCRELMHHVIRPLIEHHHVRQGKLWVCIRDFPSDQLAFWASNFCWQHHIKQPELFQRAMNNTQWLDHNKPLETLAKILEKDFYKMTAKTHQNLKLQAKLMALAQKEQRLLKIQQVPLVFLVAHHDYKTLTDVRIEPLKKTIDLWVSQLKTVP